MAIIFSLDQPLNNHTTKMLQEIEPFIDCLKINHIQLAYGSISRLVELLPNLDIFLDVKLHDIPNTIRVSVAHYIKTIPNLKYITIHGSAQNEMIIEAILATKSSKCTIISVLQLTSSNNIDTNEFLQLAMRNYNLGVRHFIVPIPLISNIKKELHNITIISPGVRLDADIEQNVEHKDDDQKFKGTPFSAKKLGADAIVVGRPIYLAVNPLQTVQEIYNQFHGKK